MDRFGAKKLADIKIIFAGLIFVFLLTGCRSTQEFFDKKPIEIHSRDIIREVSQIPVIPDTNNPMPEFFVAPPEIKTVSPTDTKLYYFSKNHPPEKLAELVKSQLGYQVDINPATNQLIVKCALPEDALVTLEFLQQVDVPPIQIRIDCLISEIFADVTMDWETSLAIGDLFGQGQGGLRTVGDAISETISLTGGGPDNVAFPGAAARDAGRGNSGLRVGFASNSGSFKAVIDMLASRGYMKIVMNPTLRTVNGKVAKITTSDQVPITKTVTGAATNAQGQVVPYSITEYVPVVDSLEVTANVYADGSVGLKTKAKIGSKSTPEGASQQSIITTREIDIEENRIKPGDSLVIGGIRKSESVGITRGAPGLENLPVLGILFSSKDQEDKVKEIMFILTPSISSAGMNYETMVAGIRQKHMKPQEDPNIVKSFMEPFCKSKYADYVEKKAAESEVARIKAEALTVRTREEMSRLVDETNAEKAKAQNDMNQAEKTKAEAQTIKAQAEQVKAETEKLKSEIELLKVQADQKKAEAEQAQAVAMKAQAEADKKNQDANQAMTDAETKITEAEQKIKEADAAKADAQKKQAEAEQAALDAQKAKEEAERMIAEAEKAKAEAEEANKPADPIINDPNNRPR
ncbi:MAG: hypothetical protein A2Y12_06025 [Planctomycetes bacterium GWF2_42_9]|nr:MAG: hypothetical protein A2Y12_06025 [Planctomycetes bacterium GWF2_42_9]HAL45792.1 hypothetical protein [Phycisphaerales bacterium]